MLAILGLWLAFGATHIGLSSQQLRPRLVGTLGDQAFQGVYSLLALALFVPLCWVYFSHQHAGPHLWYLGHLPGVRWLAYVGLALALALLVGGLMNPSPASMIRGKAEPRGALRVSRHPVFMAAGLFGLMHLLVANVNAAELVFFAGFPLFAVLGCRHQDQRKCRASEPYRDFAAHTSFLPFTGRDSLRGLVEMPLPLALGIGLAFGIRVFHAGWFGGVDWLGWSG